MSDGIYVRGRWQPLQDESGLHISRKRSGMVLPGILAGFVVAFFSLFVFSRIRKGKVG